MKANRDKRIMGERQMEMENGRYKQGEIKKHIKFAQWHLFISLSMQSFVKLK